MERTKNIYPAVIPLLERGKLLALATILDARDSTPQVPGASAAFSEDGLILGTLGGGKLEAELRKRALRCLKNGRSSLYEYSLRGSSLEGDESLCGGTASILIDGSPRAHLREFNKLRRALARRRAGLLLTAAKPGSGRSIDVERFWFEQGAAAPRGAEGRWPLTRAEVDETLREGRPKFLLVPAKERSRGEPFLFLEPLFPLPRLVIAGAGHVGRAVAHLGHLLDFEVTVIDDRAKYANRARFPEAERIIVREIGRALAEFPISDDTYVVIVTREHRHDAAALRACIRSPAAYIGMIGSRRKIALMREEFIAREWAAAEEFDRVHAPIGLPIGSTTVEEIAVSIAAELVQVRSARTGKGAGRAG